MMSDLVSDDLGTWEFAWRASTLAGARRFDLPAGETEASATTVPV